MAMDESVLPFTDQLSDAEILELLSEDDPTAVFVDELTDVDTQLLEAVSLSDLTVDSAATPSWRADPSYRHLGQDIDTTPFQFTAQHLLMLARVNHFDAAIADEDVVLFGLRGCALADGSDGSGGFRPIVELCEAPLDYVHHRCLVGAWRPAKGTIAVYRANTLPGWHYLARAVVARSNNPSVSGGCSSMMPGLYRYAVGPHKLSTAKYPDALRISPSESYAVWRPAPGKTRLCLEVTDTVWKPGNYGHNIHPSSGSRYQESNHKYHWSAGCQTLPGTIDGKRNVGVWQDFRDALGLPLDSDRSHEGSPYHYLLLTGRDARLSTDGDWAGLARIRHGSRGPQVAAVQRALGLAETGTADGTLVRTLAVKRWYDKGESADPVVTPDDAAALAVSLLPGSLVA